jgi:hypothetical protein
MSQVNSSLDAASVSGVVTDMLLRLSEHRRARAAQSPAAAVNVISGAGRSYENDGVVDTFQEMILDIQSYREALNQSLDALADSLADLDQGIARLESLIVNTKREDPFKEMFAELFRQLNQYGAGAFVDVQGNISAERALPLLESKK